MILPQTTSAPLASMELSVPAPLSKSLAKRRRRWAPRSKTGCSTCRTRRVKCDERKPICGRCIAAKIPCEGLGYSEPVEDSDNFVVITPESSRPYLFSVPAAPSVPQLKGSADVRDLLSLVPQMSTYVRNTFITNPVNTSSEYILFGGQQLTIYLDFIPCRLGLNKSLDKAVTCVVGALRDICLPPECRSPIKTLSSYTQALNALQGSLQDAKECLTAEILCAVHLLGIFESLMRNTRQTSSAHKQGVCQLYKLRGPGRFRTDFERALLISQAPVIFTDAGFTAQDCFLDGPEWRAAFKSVSGHAVNNFHLSEFKVSRYEFMIPLARTVKACNHLILHQDSLANLEERRLAVIDDVTSVIASIRAWQSRWEPILHPSKEDGDATSLGKGDSKAARENTGLAATIFTMAYIRLHIALGGQDAFELEKQATLLAVDISETHYVCDDGSAAFDIMFAGVAARAMLDTSREWQQHIERMQGTGKLIEPEIWTRWLYKWGIIPDHS